MLNTRKNLRHRLEEAIEACDNLRYKIQADGDYAHAADDQISMALHNIMLHTHEHCCDLVALLDALDAEEES